MRSGEAPGDQQSRLLVADRHRRCRRSRWRSPATRKHGFDERNALCFHSSHPAPLGGAHEHDPPRAVRRTDSGESSQPVNRSPAPRCRARAAGFETARVRPVTDHERAGHPAERARTRQAREHRQRLSPPPAGRRTPATALPPPDARPAAGRLGCRRLDWDAGAHGNAHDLRRPRCRQSARRRASRDRAVTAHAIGARQRVPPPRHRAPDWQCKTRRCHGRGDVRDRRSGFAASEQMKPCGSSQCECTRSKRRAASRDPSPPIRWPHEKWNQQQFNGCLRRLPSAPPL